MAAASLLTKSLTRLGRRLIWPWPVLYAPCGVLRRGLNVFAAGHELYIDGYPRSANTFALKAFLLANPGTLVRCHQHIPTFVVQSLKRGEPGMVLIRKPIDAAISWAIHGQEPLLQTLAYYVDYHSVLLRHRERLFFGPFEAVTNDFGRVITEFNERWGTAFVPFEHTPQNVARCLAQINEDYADTEGKISERCVPRPSACRQPLKEKLLSQVSSSRALQRELMRANRIYQRLVPKNFVPKAGRAFTKTTQNIRLRPAG